MKYINVVNIFVEMSTTYFKSEYHFKKLQVSLNLKMLQAFNFISYHLRRLLGYNADNAKQYDTHAKL